MEKPFFFPFFFFELTHICVYWTHIFAPNKGFNQHRQTQQIETVNFLLEN